MSQNQDFIEFSFGWGKECDKCKDYNKLLNEYMMLKGIIMGMMQSHNLDIRKYANDKIVDIKLLKNDLKLIEIRK